MSTARPPSDPPSVPFLDPSRDEPYPIVAIYAHPDDGEFLAGGTLAKWAARGHKLHAICSTDGAAGVHRQGVTTTEVAAARIVELGRALRVLGGEPPTALGFPDAFLRDHQMDLRERLIFWLRRLRPKLVLTFDPWTRYEVHPDHSTAGRMASEAAVFAGFPLIHEEHLKDMGLMPWTPDEVWYMMPADHRPNRVVDIKATFDKKVEALLRHSSQIEMLAGWFLKGADPDHLTDEQRQALEEGARGFLHGMCQGVAQLFAPELELAEAFYALRVGPGHFENYQDLFQEAAGLPPTQPLRVM